MILLQIGKLPVKQSFCSVNNSIQMVRKKSTLWTISTTFGELDIKAQFNRFSCVFDNSPLLRYPGWTTTQKLFLCWFHILRKMLETCASMTFPYYLDDNYQREMEWSRAISQKYPRKPIHRNCGCCTTHGYLMCSKFWTPYSLNISMQNWPPISYTWRVFLHHHLIRRKNGSNTRMTFSTHKQKSP